MIKRALVSVSDKTGIVSFCRRLREMGIELISTGGTAQTLREAGVEVVQVSQVTNFPEILDGRVKTLHPAIHGGILARRDRHEHMTQLRELGLEPVDMVVVNLYPFQETVAREGVTLEEALENIDIGGPTLVRAAAKNYRDVVVITSPERYGEVLEQLRATGTVSQQMRLELAREAFAHTAGYDLAITSYLEKVEVDGTRGEAENFPDRLWLSYRKVGNLRYGENPHQKAAFYREEGFTGPSLTRAQKLGGKDLSFNNINDANAAMELVREFRDEPAVVAVKHTNPCGVGTGANLLEAWQKAYHADPVSIFGGIVAANREVDVETARAMASVFLEVVVAPGFSPEALKVLRERKDLRILALPDLVTTKDGDRDRRVGPVKKPVYDLKKVAGGILVQDPDDVEDAPERWRTVTRRKATPGELKDLTLAWKVARHTKSNAIVVAKGGRTLGVGAGQMNRIDAARHALQQGGGETKGAVLASDAFFPFPDVVEEAARAGIRAIVQPGGSVRDEDSIKAAERAGLVMLFTGERHFKH